MPRKLDLRRLVDYHQKNGQLIRVVSNVMAKSNRQDLINLVQLFNHPDIDLTIYQFLDQNSPAILCRLKPLPVLDTKSSFCLYDLSDEDICQMELAIFQELVIE